jgi:Zn finger protein HypA/HybF involved in hydrogenase expression
MQELSNIQSILNIALNYANEAKAKRIENIHVVMGAVPNVDDSAKFYCASIAMGLV